MTIIIDYGMGNLGSISNMIKKVGFKSTISSNVDDIMKADKIILSGVGSFNNGMKNLEEIGATEALKQKVLVDKTPIMGICLGMQLMTKNSEEGTCDGLGWINAETKKFKSDTLKVPHMGWNVVRHNKKTKIFDELESEKRFYFVHSYYVECMEKDDILTNTLYTHEFVSSFEKENIIGCQFHPEKSHKFGMDLIKNFMERY